MNDVNWTNRPFEPGAEQGVTFVEAMVAALFLVLVLFAGFGMYEKGLITWSRGEKTADLHDHLRVAMNALAADIRQSRELFIRRNVVDDSFTVTVDLMELTMPNAAGSEDSIVYSWAPTGTGDTRNVLRRKAGGGPQPVAHHINRIEFSAPDPDSRLVEVVLKAEGEHRGRLIEVEMRGTFHVRADLPGGTGEW